MTKSFITDIPIHSQHDKKDRGKFLTCIRALKRFELTLAFVLPDNSEMDSCILRRNVETCDCFRSCSFFHQKIQTRFNTLKIFAPSWRYSCVWEFGSAMWSLSMESWGFFLISSGLYLSSGVVRFFTAPLIKTKTMDSRLRTA